GCDLSCISLTRSCKLSPRCEATSDERSAGNPHATFCGSRGAGDRPPATRWRSAMIVPTAIQLRVFARLDNLLAHGYLAGDCSATLIHSRSSGTSRTEPVGGPH